MDTLLGFWDRIEDFFTGKSNPKLSEFQQKKLAHEFDLFFDLNKDGCLEWKDFELAQKNICQLSGWKEGTAKYKAVHELFTSLWRNLQATGDGDSDGAVSKQEWYSLWESIMKAKYLHEREMKRREKKKPDELEELDVLPPDDFVPQWLHQYIEYKFNLYDRAGDSMIDEEEFEYTLSLFNINSKDCRAAFKMMSQAGERKIDRPYFRQLALEFYLSDEAGDLGNFINGVLLYD
ncbi:hypothetical protein CAPTEDRAFT_225832 [Capitella teleta]|uniref:EF-hand domain-containing protein n=1 Tax=Capitella teleta TaxID=283909 RepID=R7UDV7_CAPTE|nr:hypothetical protein CAPTEDRAFT_225832 [Capitella teleta]|eukprot:ELU04590.1 hypothetical protein CAPTEDRAFT_225832 [Capitella teleta]